jgi:hypothetical protein
MAISSAVLEWAGLGILADNDDDPGAGARNAAVTLPSGEPGSANPGQQTDDFERFLADLKQEVEQPVVSAMVQALRATLSRLARSGGS